MYRWPQIKVIFNQPATVVEYLVVVVLVVVLAS